MSRRSILAVGSAAITTGLAGCTSILQTGDNPTNSSPSAGTNQTETAEGSVYTDVYQETISSVVLVEANRGQGTGFQYDENHIVGSIESP